MQPETNLLDYAALSDESLRHSIKRVEGRFLTVFGHINLLAMSKEVSPEDFRIYLNLSRETRRRKRLNQDIAVPAGSPAGLL